MSREIDARGDMSAVDSFTERAVGIITSGKLAAAEERMASSRAAGSGSRCASLRAPWLRFERRRFP
jgi:hypothetical protein